MIVTDGARTFRLCDHKWELALRGVTAMVPLEVYCPRNNGWAPLSWNMVIGPFDSAGQLVLLRREGATQLKHFNSFCSVATDIYPLSKKGKHRAKNE